jgi:hypothetical protein
MERSNPQVCLGFTDEKFPAGVHICQIFSDDQERQDLLLKFILSGLQGGERIGCFSEKVSEAAVEAFLCKYGLSYKDATECGALTVSGSHDVYFKDDCFEPERMLTMLREFHIESVKKRYAAARFIGEMTPEIKHLPGGARLLEYEAQVSILLREHPVTAICQYDANSFDGAMILDILKVHPMMIVRGRVVRNPFFIAPEEFLSTRSLSQ